MYGLNHKSRHYGVNYTQLKYKSQTKHSSKPMTADIIVENFVKSRSTGVNYSFFTVIKWRKLIQKIVLW